MGAFFTFTPETGLCVRGENLQFLLLQGALHLKCFCMPLFPNIVFLLKEGKTRTVTPVEMQEVLFSYEHAELSAILNYFGVA